MKGSPLNKAEEKELEEFIAKEEKKLYDRGYYDEKNELTEEEKYEKEYLDAKYPKKPAEKTTKLEEIKKDVILKLNHKAETPEGDVKE